ncbi:MerR family transcriptional regulator [Christiangramia sp. SM2212]|uniref:MerR family transcriptional regulator n=1 Tax=Christiangramia sediminicola TaxID=3073267 RepID=A0ABU1ERC7_9FLAO|nr:MerR family transcriptional regulator [Christiangramia sp. SM2212]MDR5590940.1 MerR family transcriptional regulator [Christiangramia sp. SM2212]
MEHIKQNFSIKDLEHLSGIKAHTIRIWEKRYDILTPERTDTNIRTYNGDNLQKLLNIAFLNSHGYKISRISKMEETEITNLVKRISASSSEENRARNSFKLAMMNFDDRLFQRTYNKLREKKDFSEVFHDVFLPLLEEIGMLWQTDTIKPIHEHYIVELIKQKIYINIAELKSEVLNNQDEKLYVLFLPDNEIHDVGILYLNYELLNAGKNAIYLGPSLPLDNMDYLMKIHDNLIFVSYLTISPVNTDIQEFIEDFQEKVCQEKNHEFHLFGQRTKEINKDKLSANIKVQHSISEFINQL